MPTGEPPNDAPDQMSIGRIAEALVDHLEHRYLFRGERYVGSARLEELATTAPSARAEVQKQQPVLARSTGIGAGAPARKPAPVPSAALSRGSGPIETSAPARSSTRAREDLRAAAATWSPAQKLDYLRSKNIGDCRRCSLWRGRQNIVFGVGRADADIMFVGEAPGFEEDRRGEPFVGAAGQRLTQWIERLGYSRPDVYIANVLKCRPPSNRDPQPDEVATCSPFLRAQIRVVQPRVLIALGRFAGSLLVGRQAKLHEMRRSTHEYTDPNLTQAIPVVVTYHPAYVLRREADDGRTSHKAAPRESADDAVIGDLTRALKFVEE